MTELRYDPRHHAMLIFCSKIDIGYWNDWWVSHPDERVKLSGANLKKANLAGAILKQTNLYDTNLQKVNLIFANLHKAKLSGANLQKADLSGANLLHTFARFAEVDGGTVIMECVIDQATDFTGVGLDSARIAPPLKTALLNNIRKMQWTAWMKKGTWWQRALKFLTVKPFWHLSD